MSSVSSAHKPPSTGPLPVTIYKIIEATSQTEGSGGSWRGGWAKRFVPDEITYETSVQGTEDGMVSITHAPMGVDSVAVWKIKDAVDGAGLVLEKEGCVSSNRMPMTCIRTTIQGSYEKLVRDCVAELVRRAGAEMETGKGDAEVAVGEKIAGGEDDLIRAGTEVVA